MAERVVPLLRSQLGPDHPTTLTAMSNLAWAYQAAGRLADALPLHEQALQRFRANLGPDHRDTLGSLHRLAVAYRDAGRLAQAEKLLVEAIPLQRRTDSADSLVLASSLSLLGDCLLRQKKFTEAEPPLRQCLAIRAQKLPDHNSHFHTRSLLGAALAGQQRFAEAEPLLLA